MLGRLPILLLLLTHGIVGVFLLSPGDCDEQYNYWEPLSLLVRGRGFTTWEYQPQFALRSYLYLLIHAPVPYLFASLGGQMVIAYYINRLLLSILYMCSVYSLCRAVGHRLDIFPPHTANWLLFFFATSPASVQWSGAFLPSTFSTVFALFSLACLLRGRVRLAMCACVVQVVLGWPFTGILTLSTLIYIIGLRQRLSLMAMGAVMTTMLLGLLWIVDIFFYQTAVNPSMLNLLYYNVIQNNSYLYGTEDTTYYLKYCLLNCPATVLALFHAVLTCCSGKVNFQYLRRLYSQDASYLRSLLMPIVVFTPAFLFGGILLLQPHKEERFLTPLVPFLLFIAAVIMGKVPLSFNINILSAFSAQVSRFQRGWTGVVIMSSLLLCASRLWRLHSFSTNAMKVAWFLAAVSVSVSTSPSASHAGIQSHSPQLCVSRAWHAIPPPSFVIPPTWNVAFLNSSTAANPHSMGCLPQWIPSPQTDPLPMNDDNEAWPGSVITASVRESCDVLWLDESEVENHAKDPADLVAMHCEQLVRREWEQFPTRSFALPGKSGKGSKRCIYTWAK
jgi:alpha-1,2-mannosyltransferase